MGDTAKIIPHRNDAGTTGAAGETSRVISRIYITPEGDVVVTDLWEDLSFLRETLGGEASEN